jgi:hypothetical protein
MSILLGSGPPGVDRQQANDAHTRPGVVLAALAMLLLYAYLFTHIGDPFGIPRPQVLLESLGVEIHDVFDEDRNVDSELWISNVQRYNNDDERLILFAVVAGAFLCGYFLPLRYKRPALVFWFAGGMLVLYGLRPTAGLVLCHWLVYLSLHPPDGRRAAVYGAVPGALAYAALAPWELGGSSVAILGWALVSAALCGWGLVRLARHPRFGPVLRTVAVQAAIIGVFAGALVEGLRGDAWALPLGILLFFWHWERLIMYHVDYKDGQVPADVSPLGYLAIFLNPGALSNWNWGVTIGQGYSYATNNFLAEDKNRLVWAGLRLWAIALIYLVLGDWIRYSVADLFDWLGLDVHEGYIKRMACDFARGAEPTPASVLMTSLLDLFRWIMLWGGVVHFKVGVWRVCGYRVDPYFDRPWMATNLVSFWPRFTFHYREFLVRAFYYPVFFRFFRKHPRTRIVVATVASVGLANLVWGHMTEEMFYHGMRFENFGDVLRTWPYFMMLAAGISVTELYLLKKKSRRRPWTMDVRILLDVLAAYCTLQFFALIHIFAKPCGSAPAWNDWRLFLRAFGIELGA